MATAPLVPILQFCEDPNLLGVSLYPEQKRVLHEFWEGEHTLGLLALGRRSGKTLLAAICAAYSATVLADEYRKYLRPKERWYSLTIATNLEQSKIFLGMVRDMLEGSPILKPMIVRSTVEQIELVNGCVFRSIPSSGRGSRGMAVGFLVMDEAAHFQDTEGNSSGENLYQSLSPSIAQFNRLGKILLTSSPWIKSGLFYSLYSKASKGELPHAYTANEPSWVMNPTLSPEFIEEQKAVLGQEVFAAEYGAQWTSSLSAFLSSDLVDAAVNYDRVSLPPLDKFKGKYYLSLDPAKGGRDSYVACIIHYDGDRLVVDRWHEFQPSWIEGSKRQVSIAEVEDWILTQHSLYKFLRICLDQYNSQATIQRLRAKLPIEELVWTVPSKIQAFSKLRELFNGGTIELYPHAKSIQQLKNLVVTYRASGQWSVSGGSGAGVDDFTSALAGGALIARPRVPPREPPRSYSYTIW